MVASLLAALRAALPDTVSFHETVPNKLFAPCVIVSPGDPFLQVGTFGKIEETWEILIVTNRTQSDKGVDAYRDLSMQIRNAAHSVGAIWDGCTGPRLMGDTDDTNYVLVVNTVRFIYAP